MRTGKLICNHPEWFGNPKPEPAEVVGCCHLNYACPVCGFGVGCAPHDSCEGWSMEFESAVDLAKRIAANPELLRLTEQGQADFEAGRVFTLDEVKRILEQTG